jgi:ankyrin repeat protein
MMSTDDRYPPDASSARVTREALASAVRADNVAEVRSVLHQYPALKAGLDEPMQPDHAFGATPLLASVYNGNREMVDVLLQAGASIDARSHWWAGGFGVLDAEGDLAPFLIERGATIDIHAAARLGKLEKVTELLSTGPELVRARGGDGQTPLHFAATVAIAEYLLARGADIDARDVDHESTPAQWMVRNRQEVARALVERGCRTDILMAAALGDALLVRRHLDEDPRCIRTTVSARYFPMRNPRAGGTIYNWTLGTDKSAHALAREFGHEHVLDILMAHTPDPLKLAVACELGNAETVAALLEADPHLAQSLDDEARLKIAELMLEAGWPVDARGQHGGTPLHWAAWHGNTRMAEALLRRRAPLEVTDRDFSSTPLGWALYGSVHGPSRERGDYAGTVEALLRAGAETPRPDSVTAASDAVREVLRKYARP